MLQCKEFNPENFNTSPITFKRYASEEELHEEITANLEHQSSREKMHKLFDCIKTPLKRF